VALRLPAPPEALPPVLLQRLRTRLIDHGITTSASLSSRAAITSSDTSAGSRYRYAIGIREVLGLGLNYQSTGEFISKPYDFSQPVSRVMLDTQQAFMINSDICPLRHFLSPDAGESWQELQPVEGLSAALPHLNNAPHFFSGDRFCHRDGA
jgi:hypothetical protein